MLIAIFDMDMPRKCEWDCPFCNGEGGWCQLADVNISEDERPKECPLHETAEINEVLDKIMSEINFICEGNGVNHIHVADVEKIIERYRGEET